MTLWTVDRLGRRGEGVAHSAEGARALAPLTLPGEVISGEADRNGRLGAVEIRSASPQRVDPGCPHYADCGGCALMHASDGFVAGWKISVVETALAAQGIEASVAGIATSPLAARRRAVLAGRIENGRAVVGLHARQSDRVVDLTVCRVMRPEIVAALPLLREMTALGAIRDRVMRIAVTAGPAGLDVAVSGGRPSTGALASGLAALMEKGDLARLDWDGETLLRRPPGLRMGRATVIPPPGGFLQATAEAENALLGVVRNGVGDAARVVDLFCGSGTFTLPLAARAEIHAVEGLAAPLEALGAAWRGCPGLRRVTTERRDLAASPLTAAELGRHDAIVIDPPRSGAAAQAAEIARADVARLAWVSCDPVTFARDCRSVLAGGWQLDRIFVVDQFRFSPHVETAAILVRR